MYIVTSSIRRKLDEFRASDIGRALFFSILAFVCVFCFSKCVAMLFSEDDRNIAFKWVFGITVLIAGTILFGAQSMGLRLSHRWFRQLPLMVNPILASLLAQALGTPLQTWILPSPNFIDALGTGLWEESVFRGFSIALWSKIFTLNSWISRVIIIVLSGVIFGLVHGSQDAYTLIFRICIGIIFSSAAISSGTIIYLILLHAFHDILAGGNIEQNLKLVLFGIMVMISIISVVVNRRVATEANRAVKVLAETDVSGSGGSVRL